MVVLTIHVSVTDPLCLIRPSEPAGPDPLPDGEISHYNIRLRHAGPGERGLSAHTEVQRGRLSLSWLVFPHLAILCPQVYFNAPNMKVFDVVLNGDLTVNSDLDIFEKVGRGAAHDEYVEFSVENNKIIYQGEESEISAGKIRVEFIKSYRDNPKINAVVLIKGTSSDWPKLPPLPIEQEPDEIADDQKVDQYIISTL